MKMLKLFIIKKHEKKSKSFSIKIGFIFLYHPEENI